MKASKTGEKPTKSTKAKKSTHTQGKWKANQDLSSFSIWSENREGNYPLVAVVKFDAHKFTSNTILIEEAKANATLIASAPDMLKALNEVKKLIEWWIEDGYIEVNSADTELTLVRNAIKQATK